MCLVGIYFRRVEFVFCFAFLQICRLCCNICHFLFNNFYFFHTYGIACNIAENQSKPTWQAIFYNESLVFKLEIQYNDCWMGLQPYTSWLISYWLAEIFLTCHQVGTNIFHLKNWPVFPGTSHYGLGNFGPFFWQFRPVQTQVFSSFLLDSSLFLCFLGRLLQWFLLLFYGPV